ncbi:MAG TPA: coniferyl aldehyde dehydrogenase [Aliidongia sp.]|uniref:coniferyl aldehyde dehydrogenase n=1 Tax=Aliidongia sp. TaxID=1914230 RepID=UPI002DDCCFE5|nr:coniferyl aldehyde dehydrogenase [Aliidongia sp.]HEV2673749.1 coniferyl aldehyde dehydrogenase [Aliidongia sp.]
MGASSTSPISLAAVPSEAERILALQRAAVAEHGAPSLAERILALDALLGLIKKHRQSLVETVSLDFGTRAAAETELGELMPLVAGIKHVRRHLGRWMKPQRRRPGLAFRPASARVAYQPLGVVGVMAPWNYPLFLTLGPLIDALAAGNRVMLKPSELTPRTAALLKNLLAERFEEDQVAVVTGGPDVAAQFSTLDFDHLLFTGSSKVGRQVMAAAAAHLTPVTLELGGKSPVLVCRDYPLKKAARTIAIGKFFNAGQTCVAPDYALVPTDLADAFADAVIEAAAELYPAIAGNADYTSIISGRHYQRLSGMIEEARGGGARVVQHTDPGAAAERKIGPTVLVRAREDSAALREEIFGPILPIVTYDDLDHAIRLINARPKPLALYCFSTDSAKVEGVLQRTRSGGATINGTLLHVTQADLPFGGVGESGMGAYHGREGFLRLSHARATLELGRFNMSDRIAAPYGKLTRAVTRLLLGK